MTSDAADWPARFVYVCAATQGAMITHAPLHHAGADRLAGLVVFCAISAPGHPTVADRSNALLPADRLIRAATEVLGLPKDKVQVLMGEADLLAPWTNALHEAAAMARRSDAAILFNLTSGRKTATLGALLGAPRGPDVPEIVMLTVGLDSTIRRVDILPNGRLSERPLPLGEPQTLQSYLGCYGLRLPNAHQRREEETVLMARDQAFPALEIGLKNHRFRTALANLQMRIATARQRPPCMVALKSGEAGELAPLLSVLDGVSVAVEQLHIADEAASRFLSGIWLEGLALWALRRANSTRRDLILARGVEVAGQRAPSSMVETDFDIAILQGERLGLIECKAGRDVNLARRGLIHLAHYSGQLAAQSGGAWLLAPLAEGLKGSGTIRNDGGSSRNYL